MEAYTLWVKRGFQLKLLIENPSARCQYLIAILISIVFCYFTFSTEFINGDAPFFTKGDARQHLSGWLFFQYDEWHYPLLFTERLNAPEGLSIAFTDSIPLVAVILKIFSEVLPSNFNYFGYYVVLCFVLQAFSAVYFIRALGCKTLFSSVITVLFALFWPALLNRLGHTSLMSHFLMIFNLAFYFKYSRTNDLKFMILSSVITMISFLIHPYLFALNFSVLMALFLKKSDTNQIREKLLVLLCLFLSTVFIITTLGYSGGGQSDGGFDFFSMNIASPMCGGLLTPCVFDGTGGQYEGFNYFGIGFILLLFAIIFELFTKPLKFMAFVKVHLFLIVMCIALSIYALSNKVMLFDKLIVYYNIPFGLEFFTNTFRASGRFFWPVGYLVLFLVLANYLKKDGLLIKVTLTLLITIQMVDVSNIYESMRQKSLENISSEEYDWSRILDDNNEVYLYPRYGCGLFDDDYYLGFQYISAQNHSKVNTGYISRSNTKCDKSGYSTNINGIYVLSKNLLIRMPFYSVPDIYLDLMKRGKCAEDDRYVYCVPKDLESLESISSLGSLTKYTYRQPWSHEYTPQDFRYQIDGSNVESEGFSLFGPYWFLPEGEYIVKFELEANNHSGSDIGYFDMVGRYAENKKMMSFTNQKIIVGDNTYTVVLKIKYDVEDFEFRIFKNRGSITKFKGLKIQRVSNENG